MTVNEFAKEVHENAVAHGWWETARSFPEVAALIHSEVSEALEEWRDGNPAIYGCCGIPGAVCEFEGACDKDEKTGTCKPEGVAVELCDAIIRILDYLAYMGVDVEAVLMAKEEGELMINYFEAAEKTLRARGLLETALGNLERKKERILRYGAPSEYPSADMSKPYTGAKSVNDALADCLELAEVMREIQVTRDKVEEIDDVLAQMDEDDARILRLWYIERKSKDEITEAVCYSSTSSLYDLRNKALVRFALLYFGAGAMPSM